MKYIKKLHLLFDRRIKYTATAIFVLIAGVIYCGMRSAKTQPENGGTGDFEASDGTAGYFDDASYTESDDNIYVYVCGSVQNPGVYELPENSRVFEAVGMAGGVKESASFGGINMAGILKDGQMIYIPDSEEAESLTADGVNGAGDMYGTAGGVNGTGAANGSGGSGANPATRLININSAGVTELMSLPGIGESRANDIIRYRTENGGFGCIEDIKKVNGIKDAAYLKIKDLIQV